MTPREPARARAPSDAPSPGERVRAAGPATFAVYLAETLLALAPAWLATQALAGTGLARVPDPRAAHGLEALDRLVAGGTRPLLATTAIVTVVGLLAAPWLTMAWLRALAAPAGLLQSLGAGARLYLPAVRISLVVGTATLLGCGLAALLPFGAHHLLADSPDARLHDLSVLLACAPTISLLVGAAFVHDLARARLAARGAGRRARSAIRHAIRVAAPSTFGSFLLWTAGSMLALGVGHLLTHALGGPGAARAAAVAALGQLAVLARLLLRARWLAVAVAPAPARPTPGSGSRGPREGGSTPRRR